MFFRSRVLALLSVGLVVAGVGVALSGLAVTPPATAGALPAIGLLLPRDATFVGGLDVKRFAASPFYQKQVATQNAARLDAFRQLEAQTGLKPERDIDQLVLAGSKDKKGVALAIGRFDEARVRGAIEARPGVSRETLSGVTLYTTPASAPGQSGGIAFLDANTLVTGDLAGVRSVLEARAAGQAPLRGNVALFALVERVKAGSTFWMVGDGSLLANLPSGSVGGPGASNVSLPTLKGVIVTGDVDPRLSLSITGDATDEAAAKNLADTLRGFVSLMALQASQKPELQELANGIGVSQTANQVVVNLSVSPETLEALRPRPAASPVAPKLP